MAITLTDSMRAAANAPTVQYRTLVDLHTDDGVKRYSTEPVSWSGLFFEGRLMAEPSFEQTMRLGVDVLPSMTINLEFADADGQFSRQRPSYFRQHSMMVREVFLDVESDTDKPNHVRRFDFTITGGECAGPDKFRLEAESPLGTVRRRLFPSNAALITSDSYDQVRDNDQVLGRVIPAVTGQLYAPLLRINDVTSQEDIMWTAWFVSGIRTQSDDDDIPTVVYDFNETTLLTESASTVTINRPVAYQYYKLDAGRVGQPLLPHFVRCYRAGGARPVQNLRWWLTNSVYGVGLSETLINSQTFDDVDSYHYKVNSIAFTGLIDEQREFESHLSDLLRDSGCWLGVRDGILALFAEQSRSPVTSFTTANIIKDSLTFRDIPLEQQYTDWTVHYHDRTTAGQTVYELPINAKVSFSAGSGQEQNITSRLIGQPYTAMKMARLYARHAAVAEREYEWSTTVKAIEIEPGDLVLLSHSHVGVNSQTCEVTKITRRGTQLDLTAREIDYTVFMVDTPDLPTDPEWLRLSHVARVYEVTSWAHLGVSKKLAPAEVSCHVAVFSLTSAPNQIFTVLDDLSNITMTSSIHEASVNSAGFIIKNTAANTADLLLDVAYWTIRVT